MAKLNNVLDIFKLLDNSNCKKCGSPTCMAFAAGVFNGAKHLKECPNLDEETLAKYDGQIESHLSLEETAMDAIEQMKKQVAGIDLEAAAKRIGAEFSDGRLTLRCLGRGFSVDTDGQLSSDIHVNPWIAGPFLDHVLYGNGVEPSGKWLPIRDLESGKAWGPLFERSCERPCKQVADTNPDFFADLVDVFNGEQVQNHYESDISIVLHPLPKMPILICYWKQDGDLPSDLNIFFDATAEENLTIDFIHSLGVGLARMFQKIARTHSYEMK